MNEQSGRLGQLGLDGHPAAAGPGLPPDGPASPDTQVLARRIAASLVQHEPGWRLPRHSALARRYGVKAAEIEDALAELAARQLIRRLPDGQLYKVSPAEYLIALEGVPGLSTLTDPMNSQIVCQQRQASLREAPGDVCRALGVPPQEQVGVIRTHWSSCGEPAAVCTTYLVRELAGPFLDEADGTGAAAGDAPQPALADVPGARGGEIGRPASVLVELQAPAQALARRLRLEPGQLAAVVTTRFDDPQQHRPVALTVAVLRPELFRVVVDTAQPLTGNRLPEAAAGAGI